MAEKKISFNEAVGELEKILDRIETGDIDVDELAGKVRRASALIEICRNKLRDTENEIEGILKELE